MTRSGPSPASDGRMSSPQTSPSRAATSARSFVPPRSMAPYNEGRSAMLIDEPGGTREGSPQRGSPGSRSTQFQGSRARPADRRTQGERVLYGWGMGLKVHQMKRV